MLAQIDQTECDGCAVVTVLGELDLSNTGQLDSALSRSITRDRPIVWDLSGVGFIDLSCSYTLTAANDTATRRHARLAIVPSPAVAYVLDLAFHDIVITLSPDLTSALNAVAGHHPGHQPHG